MIHPARFIIELDFYEDRSEIELLIHCKDAYSALWDINSMLRDKLNNYDHTPEIERFFEQMLELTVEPMQYYR